MDQPARNHPAPSPPPPRVNGKTLSTGGAAATPTAPPRGGGPIGAPPSPPAALVPHNESARHRGASGHADIIDGCPSDCIHAIPRGVDGYGSSSLRSW